MSPPPTEQLAARIFMGPALRAQPDRRLVDLVRDGYDAAFEEIARRYRRPLDRFAAAIVGDRSEDVTQDAFSKALPALRCSEAEIDLRPWLYRIVRNTALNDLRGRAPVAAELSETLPGGRSTAAEVEAREELRDLMERLQALPEPQRAALVMRELEGLGHDEIAAALGVSGGAARQAIYRARATLRDGLGLLVPLPLLRTLAEHGGEAGAAGAVALGGGALKAGMATVLIAGAVGTGVAVEHHRGEGPGPEAAEAAPLVAGRHNGSAQAGSASGQSNTFASSEGRSRDKSRQDRDNSSGNGSGSGDADSLSGGTRSGSSDGGSSGGSRSGSSRRSGEDSHSGSSGPGPSSVSGSSGSGSGDRHGGRSGSDDGGSGSSGSGSSDGGSSGANGSDSSGGDSSGPGSGEIETDPVPTTEPTLSESGGGSGSSSGDLGGGDSTTSGLDESP
jgi:RNA polymerase sigma factor (sigma-70 family)